MDNRGRNKLPDLVIGNCPLGCNGTCTAIWINDSIGHRIVCNCVCHYKKEVALVQVEGPNTKAIGYFSHSGGFSG
jgi:hypothetical protein